MSKFNSPFWEWFIFIPTLLGIIGLIALILWMSEKRSDSKAEGEEAKSMGHNWDGLEELNNPLPKWWLYLFYITIYFSVAYLVLYPGSGIYDGVLKWSSTKRYNDEVKQFDAKLAPVYKIYNAMSVIELAQNKKAMRTARRIFMNNCTACHASDAGGNRGYPNLKDNDWLWGGSPANIKQSITNGRVGNMPAWEKDIKKEGVNQVAAYVLSLAKRKADPALVASGKTIYTAKCMGCHGTTGLGNKILGAPNLTDNVWLHGRSLRSIKKSIAKGRKGEMPAHKSLLSNSKIHLITAYVYSLSAKEKKPDSKKPDNVKTAPK